MNSVSNHPKQNAPLVSVVMPSLNQGRFIDESIKSVLDQDYPSIELIVMDGGSTDKTQEIVTRLSSAYPSRSIRWVSEPDTCPAHAVNKAMSLAKGTYIGWLNSDDLYTPGALSRAISAFEANPNWVMHYGHGEHINEHGVFIEAYPTFPPDTPYEKFTEGCFICQPTVFFKRSAITLIGKLDESLKMAFDFDYWLRAFKKLSDRIGFVNQVQAKSRLHAECLTIKEYETGLKEGSDSLIKHLGFSPSSRKINTKKNILNSLKKDGERNYLKKIGESGIKHAKEKPFSDPECGLYLASIGTIIYLLPPKPSKILDLGCGTGWTSIFYAKSGYEVIGQDISHDMISVANQNKIESGLDNIEFITDDFESLDFSEEFNAAIFFDCLHHCDDELLAIRSAYSALKPGGILITHEPGLGHSKTPASVKAMEEFGVNERDMPPFQIIKCGLKVGFTEYRIFPMQHELLRIFYNWNQADFGSADGKNLIKNISNILFDPNNKSSSIVVLKKP